MKKGASTASKYDSAPISRMVRNIYPKEQPEGPDELRATSTMENLKKRVQPKQNLLATKETYGGDDGGKGDVSSRKRSPREMLSEALTASRSGKLRDRSVEAGRG